MVVIKLGLAMQHRSFSVIANCEYNEAGSKEKGNPQDSVRRMRPLSIRGDIYYIMSFVFFSNIKIIFPIS